MFDTLEEALARGRGAERPFRCPEHDDTVASASVNVAKGLWFCFGCHARGRVDGSKRKAPTNMELSALIEPEKEMRLYAQAYLEMFDAHEGIYWNTRHNPAVSYQLGMGQDPLTGDATFAVHSPSGRLAGVGRRHLTQEKQSRYLYPPRWSSARSIGGTMGKYPGYPVITLVEGMADAAAVWEVGCPGIAVYGAGLHAPQVELIARLNPRLILLGFDMDEAGERAVSAAFKLLGRKYSLQRVHWSAKDPSSVNYKARIKQLVTAVRSSDYGDVSGAWEHNIRTTHSNYRQHLEDDHATQDTR